MKKLVVTFLLLALVSAAFAQTQGLTINMQLNVAAADYANNYLSYSNSPNIGGPGRAADRDQFDAASGASTLGSTYGLNAYYRDPVNATTLPTSLRGLLLFSIANDSSRVGDNLTITKASNGVITIRFVHRGTAYEMVTDNQGQLAIGPNARNVRYRKIGHTDNTIHRDFSSNGQVSGVNWTSVFNANVAGGAVGSGTTGAITSDNAVSQFYVYTGTLQFTLTGNIFTISGTLVPTRR